MRLLYYSFIAFLNLRSQMNPIIETLKEYNVSDEKIKEVFQALTDNPITAMATVQALGIPTEKIQSIMMMLMTDPSLIKDAVDELGLDFDKVVEAKSKLS
jgi:hypothetical protein